MEFNSHYNLMLYASSDNLLSSGLELRTGVVERELELSGLVRGIEATSCKACSRVQNIWATNNARPPPTPAMMRRSFHRSSPPSYSFRLLYMCIARHAAASVVGDPVECGLSSEAT